MKASTFFWIAGNVICLMLIAWLALGDYVTVEAYTRAIAREDQARTELEEYKELVQCLYDGQEASDEVIRAQCSTIATYKVMLDSTRMLVIEEGGYLQTLDWEKLKGMGFQIIY